MSSCSVLLGGAERGSHAADPEEGRSGSGASTLWPPIWRMKGEQGGRAMEEPRVAHDTVVVCRTYNASTERVYRAWTDSAELERWYVPGDQTWSAKMLKHDVRVGVGKRFTFGPPDETFVEDCH